MKKILPLVLGLSLLQLTGACQQSTSVFQGKDGDRTTTISVRNGNHRLEIKVSGNLRFNDEETGIRSISDDGFLKYENDSDKLSAETGKSGEIVYTILIQDGEKLSPDTEAGRKFIAEVIKELIERGLGAKDRAERLYTKGGTTAVISALKDVRSDNAKSVYLSYLLDRPALSRQDRLKIVTAIGEHLDSDMEKGKLLSLITAEQLKDKQLNTAFLQTVSKVNSDMEKGRILKKQIEAGSINAENYDLLLEQINHIHSDMEKGGVLKKLMATDISSESLWVKLLGTTATISSDMEKGSVLTKAAAKMPKTETVRKAFISATENIHSDMEKSRVLRAQFNQGALSEANFNLLLNQIVNIGSDMEKCRLLRQMTQEEIKTEAQWISLIHSASMISSAMEKSNVLQEIGGRMPKTDNVKSAFMKAAKTITSDNEYGKVMRMIS